MNAKQKSVTSPPLVLVTGPSGAGRTTAVHALEDFGFETIDNIPLSLLPRLFAGGPIDHQLALGIDVRNRDFSTEAMLEVVDRLLPDLGLAAQLLYLDCSEDILARRFSETRRRHPLSPDEAPLQGIRTELELLGPIRDRSDILIDTSAMTPHELRAELLLLFGPKDGKSLSVTVQSFSYKRGLPRGLDMVFDCRFLRNPHWEEMLRPLNGRDPKVDAYVAQDPRFGEFFQRIRELSEFLLPAYEAEGKTHLSIGLGCTGGQHRSVAIAERLVKALAESGWQVSKRHRELERQAGTGWAKRDSNG